MGYQLVLFLNALTDLGVTTLDGAVNWLAGKTWADSLEIAAMIYIDDDLKESFDLKDLEHELRTFVDRYDGDEDLESLVRRSW